MVTSGDLSIFREKRFSEAIQKLDDLLAQGRRAFLIGAGCSKCAGLPLTSELTPKVLDHPSLNPTTRDILILIKDLFSDDSTANLEDYLSELIDLLAIAQRRGMRGAKQFKINVGTSEYSENDLRNAVEEIKKAVAKIISQKVSIETHRAFVAAVHRPLRVGKVSSVQGVDYLVLNYDTAIEDSLALERIPFSDGIDGGVTGWWNPNIFDRGGLAARVLKLHGSIDWCEISDDPLPRRFNQNLEFSKTEDRRILIWPASTKYLETQLDPFAQLINRARQVMRSQQGSQGVLIICGYGFRDAHINHEIDRALRESAGDLNGRSIHK